ncbi:hypothetical protein AAIM68_002522 [Salmonella enterica]
MSENPFIVEVCHRAELLSQSLNPGKAIEWSLLDNNREFLSVLQRETKLFMFENIRRGMIVSFWKELCASKNIMGFIRCLGPAGTILCKRGEMGDPFSIPVLHLVIEFAMTNYIGFKSDCSGGQIQCTNTDAI